MPLQIIFARLFVIFFGGWVLFIERFDSIKEDKNEQTHREEK